jgi:uncharacterized protein (DUF2164 family)
MWTMTKIHSPLFLGTQFRRDCIHAILQLVEIIQNKWLEYYYNRGKNLSVATYNNKIQAVM